MENCSNNMFTVNIKDVKLNEIYTIYVTAEEIDRLKKGFSAERIEENENIVVYQQDTEGEKEETDDSAFKWSDRAILLIVEEFRSREEYFNTGKISLKKLWNEISIEMCKNGHFMTGPQCQSKFSGMKRTYKKIQDHNSRSGNSRRTWPYFEVMDNLLKEKPFITPINILSTGRKRQLSKSEIESVPSTSSGNPSRSSK